MSKPVIVNIFFIVLLAIIGLSFAIDLEYKDVAGGKLKILIPKGFVHKTEKVADAFNPNDSHTGEIYANKDSSVEISFALLTRDNGFAKMRGMGKMMSPIMSADPANGFKENFNDTTTINGCKVYLFDFQGKMFGKKAQRIRFFMINTSDHSILGTLSYSLEQSKQWSPLSVKILHSIKLN